MQITTGLHMELYNVDRELMHQQLPAPVGNLRGGGTEAEPAEVVSQR
jgi:hypothetical protein